MDASSHSAQRETERAAGFSPRGQDCGSPQAGATVLGWLGVLARGPGAGSHTDPFHLRRWFVAFLLWLAVLTVIGVVSFARHEGGVSGARGVWLVSLALFYLSLCCVFLPAPTTWIVMLLASNQVALFESIPLRVGVVTCFCAFASALAHLNEYYLITFLLRYGWVSKVRHTRTYRVAARWFSTAPFVVIAVVGFLPIPVDVVRWLAIAARYSRWRFFLAYFAGRSPRYALFAVSAVWFDLNWWQILIIQAALVLLAAAKVLHAYLRNRAGRKEPDGLPTGTCV